MAGDWIKMRCNLWDDPRVAGLCDLTDAKEATIIGGLYWLWATADQHSEHGVMPAMTVRSIDRKTGIKGFGIALVSIGWLEENPDGVCLSRFDEHNGESAKVRAQTARRVARHKGNAQVTEELTQGTLLESENANCESVSPALPREEKRREDKNKTPRAARFDPKAHLEELGVEPKIAEDWLALRKVKKLAPTETAFAGVLRQADKAGISMNDAVHTCCLRGWGGFEAAWLKNQPPPSANGSSIADDYADLMRGSL